MSTSAKSPKLVKFAARVAIDNLFALDGQDSRRLLVESTTVSAIPLHQQLYPELEMFTEDSTESYSGLWPHVYVDKNLSLEDSIHKTYHGLRLLARDLYLNPQLDRADLSAWIDDGFPFTFGLVSKRELVLLDRYRSAINIAPSSLRQANLLRGVAFWREAQAC